MKTYIAYGAFFLALATAAIGCDNKSGSNNAVVPTCSAPNYISNGVCVGPNGGPIDNGTGPATYADGSYNNYVIINGAYRTGNLRITDTGAYKDFLKTAMGVCDRYSKSNSGYYSCDSWMNGTLTVQMQVASTTTNQATLQFSATQGTYNGYFSGYAGVILPIPYQNPLNLGGSPLSVINNYAGFDISRTVNLNTVQLIVRNGKLGDATINYELAYGSQKINPARVFATGTLTRSY